MAKECGWCGGFYQGRDHWFETPQMKHVSCCSPRCLTEAKRNFGEASASDYKRQDEERIKRAPERRESLIEEGGYLYKKKYGKKGSLRNAFLCIVGGMLVIPIDLAFLGMPGIFTILGLALVAFGMTIGVEGRPKSREEVEKSIRAFNSLDHLHEAGIPITYDDF